MKDKIKWVVVWMNPQREQCFYYENYAKAIRTYNDLRGREIDRSYVYLTEVRMKYINEEI